MSFREPVGRTARQPTLGAKRKVMSDPRFHPDRNPMPFDGRRMIFGGFEVLVDA